MDNKSKKLQDKVALVTGSDSGIGQASAIEFAKSGADIIVTYLHDRNGAEHTKAEIEKAGQTAYIVQVDVSDEKQVEAMFDKALEKFGTIDILMNDAGIDSSGTQVADMPTEVWDKAIKTNLYGYFFCCRRFINITSIHADYPRAGAADYDCSKAGEKMLTQTLWLELAPLHINVNNIAPGMVLTPFNQQDIDNPEVYKKDAATIPWKRAAQPEEVGKLATYLASDDADYVDGTTVTIDGGLILNFAQGA